MKSFLLSSTLLLIATAASAQTLETETFIRAQAEPNWKCSWIFWGWQPNCGAGHSNETVAPVVTMVNTQVEVDCPPEEPTDPNEPPKGPPPTVPPVTGELPNGKPFPGKGPKGLVSIPYPRCETCYRTRTTYYVNGIRTGSQWSKKRTEITVVSHDKGPTRTASLTKSSNGVKSSGGGGTSSNSGGSQKK